MTNKNAVTQLLNSDTDRAIGFHTVLGRGNRRHFAYQSLVVCKTNESEKMFSIHNQDFGNEGVCGAYRKELKSRGFKEVKI